jgi:hypothetical protein
MNTITISIFIKNLKMLQLEQHYQIKHYNNDQQLS